MSEHAHSYTILKCSVVFVSIKTAIKFLGMSWREKYSNDSQNHVAVMIHREMKRTSMKAGRWNAREREYTHRYTHPSKHKVSTQTRRKKTFAWKRWTRCFVTNCRTYPSLGQIIWYLFRTNLPMHTTRAISFATPFHFWHSFSFLCLILLLRLLLATEISMLPLSGKLERFSFLSSWNIKRTCYLLNHIVNACANSSKWTNRKKI